MAFVDNQQDQTMDYGSPDAAPADPFAAPEFDLMSQESWRLAGYWRDQLDHVKDEYKKFEKRGRTIEKRYRDERARLDAYGEEGTKRYAALWSNVQTLLPTLYGRMPTPICERRFKDKDPTGRGAASMLERGLRNEVEINGFDEAVNQVVLDYLLPGRGTAWVRYEPELEEGVSIPVENEMDMRDAQGDIEDEDNSPAEVKLRNTGDRVIRESVPVDYLPWSDFFTFPAKARTWKEVVAVAKRVYMTRDQMKRRFGEDVGKRVPLQQDDRERRRQRESVVPDDESEQKGEIYEIWSRTDQRVYWVAEGYDFLCDRRDDPLELEGFFPTPRPLFANATNNTLVPVADYMQYQDQALQIDELVNRISMLTKACKVAGVYNAAAQDIKRLMDETVENELIPVDAWAAFAEKGGIGGQIALLPLKEIIGVINELNAQLDKTMAQMDRLTGITDIMRGTGDARETMGGQKLKSNAGGTRLSKRQGDVARFCRDLLRLVADVMCRHFSPQSLIEASGALYEEGLGPADMDMVAQQMPTVGGQAQAGGVPPPTPPLAAPGAGVPSPPVVPAPAPNAMAPPPMRTPGQISGLNPGGMPPQPMGGNVVPFGGPPPRPLGPLGMPAPPQVPPQVMAKIQAIQRINAAIDLLRNERLRGFRVDIEVDSTIYGDAQQEKADRVEFIGAVTKYLQTAAQLGAQVPTMVPLLGKLLQFGVRGFRVGRDLESAIDDFVDEAEEHSKQAAANPQQRPSPEAIKAQSEQQKGQLEMAKAGEQMKQLQIKTQSDTVKAQAEVARQQTENQGEAYNAQMDLESKKADERMRATELEIERLRLQIELAKVQATAIQAHAQMNTPVAAPTMPEGMPGAA